MKTEHFTSADVTECALAAIGALKDTWEQVTEKTAANADLLHQRAYGVFVLWNELTGSQSIDDRMKIMRLVDEIPIGSMLERFGTVEKTS